LLLYSDHVLARINIQERCTNQSALVNIQADADEITHCQAEPV